MRYLSDRRAPEISRSDKRFYPMLNQSYNMTDAQTLAQAIINTIPEPFIVLDDRLRVLAASRSFTFKVDPESTIGCPLYALGEGQWDITAASRSSGDYHFRTRHDGWLRGRGMIFRTSDTGPCC